jgi:hypothetical protein
MGFGKTKMYTVYNWHYSSEGPIAEDMSVEEIMELDFNYVKFNIKEKIAWVTNCCNFKTH